MMYPTAAILLGLVLLVWSADKFVDGAATSARYFGLSPLLIGMVIVGFGTSAPELVVSSFASIQGNSGIALGNAYGSNISNIALILGVTAVIRPITVHSTIIRKEIPILLLISLLAGWQLLDGEVSTLDAIFLLFTFALLMGWTAVQARQKKDDPVAVQVEADLTTHTMSLKRAIWWLLVGLLILIISSRILVSGAVEVAHQLGVNDLLIGLTVVAVGTSLPELASSIIAARKGEHDLALGNILGSNLFNTLIVVGVAGMIHPLEVPADVINRDIIVMIVLTTSLLFFGYRVGGHGQISRLEGSVLMLSFIGYTAYLIFSVT